MFRTADLVVLTKIDLLPHLRVSVAAIEDALAHVMPSPALLKVSAATGEGIDRWLAWLEHQRHRQAESCRMQDADAEGPRIETHDARAALSLRRSRPG